MAISPYAAIPAVALSAFKFGEGVSQTRKGKKLLNTARPTYKTPQAEEDAYRAAKFNYGTSASNIQEAGRNALDENFSEQVGAIGQTATDSSQMLAALTAAGAARNRASVQLDNNAISQKQNDLNSLLSASHTYSQYKDKEWQWNKQQPYQDAMLAASSLIKAGKENKYGALNEVANVGTSLLGNMGQTTPEQPVATPEASAAPVGINSGNVFNSQTIQQQNPNITPEYLNYLMGLKTAQKSWGGTGYNSIK